MSALPAVESCLLCSEVPTLSGASLSSQLQPNCHKSCWHSGTRRSSSLHNLLLKGASNVHYVCSPQIWQTDLMYHEHMTRRTHTTA